MLSLYLFHCFCGIHNLHEATRDITCQDSRAILLLVMQGLTHLHSYVRSLSVRLTWPLSPPGFSLEVLYIMLSHGSQRAEAETPGRSFET